MNKFTLLLITVLSLLTISATANIEPTPATSTLQVTIVSKNKVQIQANITNNAEQYFELEKSYDNKTFTTICVLMPFESNDATKLITIKDNVTKKNKKIYYRLKKVQDNNLTYTAQQSIKL
jgi:hypothetical protein